MATKRNDINMVLRIAFLILFKTLFVDAGKDLNVGDVVSFTPKVKMREKRGTTPEVINQPDKYIKNSSNYDLQHSQTFNLSTTFEGGTGSYGNMWDVKAIRTIVLTGVDFHTDKPIGSLMNYEVWTKGGSYKGFESNESAWTLHNKGVSISNGSGSGTPIDRQNFEPIRIEVGEVLGFYLTLDHFDLRYTDGSEEGSTYKFNRDLIITEGIGIGSYRFGESFYRPRIWNGVIHYINADVSIEISNAPSILPSVAPSPSSTAATEVPVSFKFNVNYPSSMEIDNLMNFIRESVETRLGVLLAEGNIVLGLRGGYSRVYVTNVLVKQAVDPSSFIKCKIDSKQLMTMCTLVEVVVTVSHSGAVSEADLKNFFLKYLEDLALSVANSQMGLQYVGEIPSVVRTVITLSGNNFKNRMVSQQTLSFEQTVKAFLQNEFGSISVKINDVKVEDQSLVRRRKLRKRSHSPIKEAKPDFEITTTISGEYIPPPDIDFSATVDESFSKNGQLFVQGVSKMDFFEGVTGVETDSVSTNQENNDITSTQSISTSAPSRSIQMVMGAEDDATDSFFQKTFTVSVYVLLGLLLLTVLVFFTRKRQREKKHHIPRIEELMENRTFIPSDLNKGNATNAKHADSVDDALTNVNENFSDRHRPPPPPYTERHIPDSRRGVAFPKENSTTASSTRSFDDENEEYFTEDCVESEVEGEGALRMSGGQMRAFFENNQAGSFRSQWSGSKSEGGTGSLASGSVDGGEVVGGGNGRKMRSNRSMNSNRNMLKKQLSIRPALRKQPSTRHQYRRVLISDIGSDENP